MRQVIMLLLLPIFLYSNDLSKFLYKIGHRESGSSYTAVGGNNNKYFGKYQFSNIVMKEIGWTNITVTKFKKDKTIFPPEKQEEAMRLLIKAYKQYLSKEISLYSGKHFNGVYITESGIVGAVHAMGCTEVKKYFKHKSTKPKSVEFYLKYFAGYTLK